MEALTDKRFSQLSTAAGTAAVVAVFLGEVRERTGGFHQHVLYLNAVLRCGAGASMALLGLLTLAELAACAVLVIPILYKQLGTEVPSISLWISMTVEMVLYHGFGDWEITMKFLFLSTSLAGIALLRSDTKARGQAMGVPVQGVSLSLEAGVRRLCTAAHAAILCPPVCGVLAIRALIFYRYWSFSGTNYEIARNSFTLALSQCSVLLHLAGHDRSPTYRIWETIVLRSQKCLRKLAETASTKEGVKKRL
jgi:hypothetical protein